MALKDLSAPDLDVVRQCLAAIADGPFIADGEFVTRLGVPRTTLRALLAAWPTLDDAKDDSGTCLAMNNAMNEVLHGVHIEPRDWEARFTIPIDQVQAVYQRWARSRGWSATGIR